MWLGESNGLAVCGGAEGARSRVREYERGRLAADSVRAHARQSASEGVLWPVYRPPLGDVSATLGATSRGDISANLGDPLACRGLSDQKGGGGGEDGGGGDAAG